MEGWVLSARCRPNHSGWKTDLFKNQSNLGERKNPHFASQSPCHTYCPCKCSKLDDFLDGFHCGFLVRHSCGIRGGTRPHTPHSHMLQGPVRPCDDSGLIYVFSIILHCGCSCQVCTALFSWGANKLSAIFLHQDFTHCYKLSQMKEDFCCLPVLNTFKDPGYGVFPQAAETPESAYSTFLCTATVNLVTQIAFVFSLNFLTDL